jgi:nucleoid DNA-binding protein
MATKTAAQPAAKAANRKPAAKKPTAAKASPAKAAVKIAKPAEDVKMMDSADQTGDAAAKVVAQLRVKDLIERVASASEQNKKDVRLIVEATLAELGKALETGESLNLPPLGKVRIANQRSDETGLMMTLKLRRNAEKKPGKNDDKEALAEVSEAS